MKRSTRTEEDFIIESIAGLKDGIRKHTIAGFEHIPDAVVYRRFFQLVKFLQDKNLTLRIVYTDKSKITDEAKLKNSDLNDKGFYFLRYALSKWEDRFHKDQGDKKEWDFFEKWYRLFVGKNSDLFDEAQ